MNVSINVVSDAFLQSTENKTLLRIIKHSNFHFDAIKIIKDVSTYWLLIDIYWKNRVNSITYDEIYADCREKS